MIGGHDTRGVENWGLQGTTRGQELGLAVCRSNPPTPGQWRDLGCPTAAMFLVCD